MAARQQALGSQQPTEKSDNRPSWLGDSVLIHFVAGYQGSDLEAPPFWNAFQNSFLFAKNRSRS
jgi:hypothetical protein